MNGRERALRIAVAYPGYSPETFVQAHLDHLNDVVLYLWDGFPPRRAGDRILLHEAGFGRLNDALMGRMRGRDLHAEHVQRITKELRRSKADVVLAEFGYQAAEMIAPCAKANVPLVAHFHGIDAHGHKYLERYGKYAGLFRSAAAIIAVSRHMHEHLLALGSPRDRTFHICYGVDMDRFDGNRKPAQAPHFLAIGRFVEKKAPHLMILAFAKVLQKVPDARLTMIGDGRLWGACVQLVKALGLSGSVDLTGARDHDQVAGSLHMCTAFVQHSVTAMDGDSEGTPVAVLEALASGVPVIATRHAGIPDVVQHEVNGLLCDELDIDTMASNMLRVIAEPEFAAALGRSGRETAMRDFPLQGQIAKLRSVLERVVK